MIEKVLLNLRERYRRSETWSGAVFRPPCAMRWFMVATLVPIYRRDVENALVVRLYLC